MGGCVYYRGKLNTKERRKKKIRGSIFACCIMGQLVYVGRERDRREYCCTYRSKAREKFRWKRKNMISKKRRRGRGGR